MGPRDGFSNISIYQPKTCWLNMFSRSSAHLAFLPFLEPLACFALLTADLPEPSVCLLGLLDLSFSFS